MPLRTDTRNEHQVETLIYIGGQSHSTRRIQANGCNAAIDTSHELTVAYQLRYLDM